MSTEDSISRAVTAALDAGGGNPFPAAIDRAYSMHLLGAGGGGFAPPWFEALVRQSAGAYAHGLRGQTVPRDTLLEALKKRFINDEITEDEFTAKRAMLEAA